MRSAIRLATIHSHRLFEDCLRQVLGGEGRFEVLSIDRAAGDTGDVLRQIQKSRPAVLLLDSSLPDQSAVELIRAVRRELTGTRVLVIVSSERGGRVLECIEAGAHGCISEETSIDELKTAIDMLLAGRSYCTQRATESIFAHLAEAAKRTRPQDSKEFQTLTTREREILELVSDRYSNKEIARELNISLYTVKNHVHSILEKLSVENRREAAVFAGERESR